MNAPSFAPCAKNAPSLVGDNEGRGGGGGVSHRLRPFPYNPRPARTVRKKSKIIWRILWRGSNINREEE